MQPAVPVIIIFPKMPELSKERRGVRNDGYDTSVAHESTQSGKMPGESSRTTLSGAGREELRCRRGEVMKP